MDEVGQLFDYLRERFGVGDYDESWSTPYWRWRAVEVTKMKSMMRRRQVTVDELRLAADHLIARGQSVMTPFGLLEHIALAKRDRREQMGTPLQKRREELTEAAQEAWERGMQGWAETLLNTAPGEAETVLARYQEARDG